MKILSVLLVILMLMAPALATETEEAAPLSVGELENYVAAALRNALKGEHSSPTPTDGGYAVQFAGGTLIIAEPTIDDDTDVYAFTLAPGYVCPRGLVIGNALDALADMYPNHNANLSGDYYGAVMYLNGDLEDGTGYGVVTRDGQRVKSVEHGAMEQSGDGAQIARVTYLLRDGLITGIEITGLNTVLADDKVTAEFDRLSDLQEKDEYFAYASSSNGAELDMFMREDLQFSDLDFIDLTPESAMRVLGAAQSDTWMLDSTGDYLRFMQWNGVEIIFQYDGAKLFKFANTLSLNEDIFEGPRGVRVGDSYFSVRERFMHGQGAVNENQTLLYGDGETPPYAVQNTSAKTATLNYVLKEGDKTVFFYVTFDINWIVTSFMLYAR